MAHLPFAKFQFNKTFMAPQIWGSAALALSLLLGNVAEAKSLQIEGIRYQPEGLVIQVIGGKLSTPQIETFPNESNGIKSELLVVRMPNCDADYTHMQQAALQEIGSHPEVKQFWITPLDTNKKSDQGVQVVLEIELGKASLFTPEVLAQGGDQWVITLQSVASKLTNRPIQPPAEKPALGKAAEPESTSQTEESRTSHKKRQARAEEQPSATAQNLLTALNQAKQRQAELGTQVVALQQALAETEAQKEALQSRLNSYENLLEETGVNPRDEQSEDRVIINNLKSALVKVVQKLKATEEALAKANAKSAEKPSQPVRNLVETSNVPPIATLGLLEDERSIQPPPQHIAFSPQVHAIAPLTGKSKAANSPAKAVAKAIPAITLAGTPSHTKTALGKPGTNVALNNVYQAATNSLKKDDPETRLQNAISKNPILVDNYLSLADYYIAKKDWAKAQTTLINLTHVEPGGAQGYYYLAMIYLCQKERHNAQVAIWRYAQRNPKDRQGILTLKRAMQANSKATTTPKATVASKSKDLSLDLGH